MFAKRLARLGIRGSGDAFPCAAWTGGAATRICLRRPGGSSAPRCGISSRSPEAAMVGCRTSWKRMKVGWPWSSLHRQRSPLRLQHATAGINQFRIQPKMIVAEDGSNQHSGDGLVLPMSCHCKFDRLMFPPRFQFGFFRKSD